MGHGFEPHFDSQNHAAAKYKPKGLPQGLQHREARAAPFRVRGFLTDWKAVQKELASPYGHDRARMVLGCCCIEQYKNFFTLKKSCIDMDLMRNRDLIRKDN